MLKNQLGAKPKQSLLSTISSLSDEELRLKLENQHKLYKSIGANLPDKGEKILTNITAIQKILDSRNNTNINNKSTTTDTITTIVNNNTTNQKEEEEEKDIIQEEEEEITIDFAKLTIQDRNSKMKEQKEQKNHKLSKENAQDGQNNQQQHHRSTKLLSIDESRRLYEINKNKHLNENVDMVVNSPEVERMIKETYRVEESEGVEPWSDDSSSEDCDVDNEYRTKHDIYDESYAYKLHDEFGEFVDDEESSVPQNKYN
ncbi:hypothetical protein DFA_05417 [Cavenderia fasciculata]|uniref:Uncharacterized protein n=1 Tax=Cavenderia fasciculata TaxID=261658 RepID=F4PL63_CACFS|nr:uncharacterized protein DFA_05417 [Cavenderia fasciculata]EGG23285.1 hypothetical protein DFA_05417 [Cavenderia fasciculata]|eukprot:XP_004361136.1 hypothetical protein DFA_05417 [Cavenderia fasciculata]